MSLIRKIKDYYKRNKEQECMLFTTPSHAQGCFIPQKAADLLGEKFYKCDFSEIDGFDNLRDPKGILKNIQTKLTKIYDTKQTFMLTNGSTSGIIAALISAIKPSDKVLIARNCHISVFNALVITGAKPIWFLPKYDSEWDVFEGVKVKDIQKEITLNPDIKALIITSPTYEGIHSDIENISKLCKKHNIKLIVDEAHGALLNFYDLNQKPAIKLGADISIQSLHKTAGAPNPCALMHISKKSDITQSNVQDALNLINTTSPSYPLILAIEATTDYLASMNGKNNIKKLISYITELKNSLKDKLLFYENNSDSTKLLVKFKNVSPKKASGILNRKFLIEEEFTNKKALLFITGIGTDKRKINKLKSALSDIATNYKSNNNKSNQTIEYSSVTIPKSKLTPKEAYYRKRKTIPKELSKGKICSRPILNYPPGIPLIISGEVFNDEIISMIEDSTVEICE